MHAEELICNELLRAFRDHKGGRTIDALVIIRGGGTVADLPWLSNLVLARVVCNLPVPVITGISHERNSCMLDEYAHIKTGTPSKAIQYIVNHLVLLALDAE